MQITGIHIFLSTVELFFLILTKAKPWIHCTYFNGSLLHHKYPPLRIHWLSNLNNIFWKFGEDLIKTVSVTEQTKQKQEGLKGPKLLTWDKNKWPVVCSPKYQWNKCSNQVSWRMNNKWPADGHVFQQTWTIFQLVPRYHWDKSSDKVSWRSDNKCGRYSVNKAKLGKDSWCTTEDRQMTKGDPKSSPWAKYIMLLKIVTMFEDDQSSR
jgi:hypothetical protein